MVRSDTRRAAILATITGAVITGAAAIVTAYASYTPVAVPAPDSLHWSDGVAVCLSEDGSTPGQAFPCRWEAAHEGNGIGATYTLVGPVCEPFEIAASDLAHRMGQTLRLACDDAESQRR